MTQTSNAGLGGGPESRVLSQKKTNRREEREKRSRGLIPVHVNSKHSSDWVGFLEQSIKRPSKNKQLPFNTGLLQYWRAHILHLILFFSSEVYLILIMLFALKTVIVLHFSPASFTLTKQAICYCTFKTCITCKRLQLLPMYSTPNQSFMMFHYSFEGSCPFR